MTKALLSCEKLTAGYGGCAVLREVALALHSGEVVGIIGANGAGKSTLLHTLAGLLEPISGTVTGPKGEASKSLAYLEQSAMCHWPIRVEEAVALGRIPHQPFLAKPSQQDKEAVEQAMVDADVTHLRKRRANSLSIGEQARVALARALAVEPQVLLVDEPVAGLDPAHQLSVMALLQAKAKAGMAVAAVLHDLPLASRFCDRLLLLHEGAVAACGVPEEVLTDTNMRHALSVEVVQGKHRKEAYVLPWQVAD